MLISLKLNNKIVFLDLIYHKDHPDINTPNGQNSILDAPPIYKSNTDLELEWCLNFYG